MATFTFLTDDAWNSYSDLGGGTVLSKSSTSLIYVSLTGYRVELHGTGFTFNAEGLPTGGTITGLDVYLSTTHLAQYTGLTTALPTYVTLALGLTAGVADATPTDMTAAYVELRSGNDKIYGSNFARTYEGFSGNDTFVGGSGDDWFIGGTGSDAFYGGEGRDGVSFWQEGQTSGVNFAKTFLVDGYYQNLKDGTSAKDYAFSSIEMFEGTDLNDVFDFTSCWRTTRDLEIWLLDGDDIFKAGAPGDSVYGGGGNDTLVYGALLDGGAGTDTFISPAIIAFWSADAGGHGARVNASLSTGQIRDDGFGNTETITDFDGVPAGGGSFYGTRFADRFIGGAAGNLFAGNGGNDYLAGNAGNDQLYGGDRQDSILGGSGDDEVEGGAGEDTMAGGAGYDHLGFWGVNATGHGVTVNLTLTAGQVRDDGFGNVETATGFEALSGSQFGDRLIGSGGANLLWGNDGNDTLSGAGGGDDIGGGWGSDLVNGGRGNDSLGGGGNNDTLTGGGGVDQFYFGWDLPDVGMDRITDFVAGSEIIWVGSWWGGGFVQETLLANQFRSGAGVVTANSSTQRFIYNTSTGALYFDADGNGGGAAPVNFATLPNLAALTFADIHIMF